MLASGWCLGAAGLSSSLLPLMRDPRPSEELWDAQWVIAAGLGLLTSHAATS